MPKIYLGLAQWHHSKWYLNSGSSDQTVKKYCASFSSVEGNTSFYAIPSEKNLLSWSSSASEGFKFCFKFPREISHKQCLTHCSRQVSEFLNRISLINDQLGVIWLQLDHHFDRDKLPLLEGFLARLPLDFSYGVEVRSLDYYRKDDIEKRFNQLLMQHNIDRVIFDTRSLFAHSELSDEASLEAFKAKPKVPTHVIATSKHPMVRIIVPMDIMLGKAVLKQWAAKIVQWVDEGKEPFVFLHTPDNAMAPKLALIFSELLQEKCNFDVRISLWNQESAQSNLF
jgi:uncharacterized protein YecE (DUF72 family)